MQSWFNVETDSTSMTPKAKECLLQGLYKTKALQTFGSNVEEIPAIAKMLALEDWTLAPLV